MLPKIKIPPIHKPQTKKQKEPTSLAPVEDTAQVLPVLDADLGTGLTTAQAHQRTAAGLDNHAVKSPTKSEWEIVRDNVFTFFNLVFIVLAACLGAVGSFANMTFLGVVVCNTVIGIVQQLRSKHTIDDLTLVSAHKVRCLRDGQLILLANEELVRDDIVEFSSGDQICADAILRSGEARANEALITGEARSVPKEAGDVLRSGSFLVSGKCLAQLTAVGPASYANRLATQAKDGHQIVKGKMMQSLDKLIRWIGIALVPMGLLLFNNHINNLNMPLRESVEATVGALIGMIPEGLYLLTSVALAVSMIRLAQRKVLAQDMNCIETLARVDVLCVDKTGTITEARMEAAAPELLAPEQFNEEKTNAALHNFYAGADPDNDTARALVARFGGAAPKAAWQREHTVPFNSAYKWSAATFAGQGSFIIGAPEFVAGARYPEVSDKAGYYMAKGSRVLLMAHYDGVPDPDAGLQAERMTFVALLPVANRIRPEAPQTFRYFAQQGVAVKVISGDNPLAVSEVARQAGIAGAEHYVDAATLHTDAQVADAIEHCTVFGRVTPDQKRQFVHALQKAGHTVAMTGDGVNDVLALKDADCGIAMASGAQAASQVAQIVLLESDFSGLPAVVAEGRRVINNIQRSASLFLVKNIFSFLLALISIFISMAYPLQPLQLTLISAVGIGIPSFILALESNHELVRGKFISNVLKAALPGGLTNLLLVLGVQAFAYAFDLPYEITSTIVTLLMLTVGMAVLWQVCKPFTPAHAALWGGMVAASVLGVVFFGSLLGLVPLDLRGILVLGVFMLLVVQTLRLLTTLPDRLPPLCSKLWRELKAHSPFEPEKLPTMEDFERREQKKKGE